MQVVPITSAQGLEDLMNQLFGSGQEPEETPSEKELNQLLETTFDIWKAAHGGLKTHAMMAFVRGSAMAIHCGNKHKDANLGQTGEVGEAFKNLMQGAWLQAEGLPTDNLCEDEPWSEEQKASLAALGEVVGPVIRQAIKLLDQMDKELEALEQAAGDPADSHPV